MTYNKIPLELRELRQWGLYRRTWNEEKQKYDKEPLNPHNGYKGRSNDESTWSDFQTALSAMERFKADGLAFYFKPPYVGIDLDDIGDDLERYLEGDIENNIVYVFMNATKTYAEVSMSGKGIHIIGKGEIPGERRRKGDVEMYTDGRFFAITGNFFGSNDEINEIPPIQMDFLYKRYLDDGKIIQGNFRKSDWVDGNDLSVTDIIQAALASKTGHRFKLFMDGGWERLYESQSEADLAFANMLAFWSAADFEKMDEIFRMSAMMRDKYDRKTGKTTYGIGLLNKAISESSNHYTGKKIDDSYSLKIPGITSDETQSKKFYSHDDTGNAERFVDVFGEISRFSYVNKIWYFYNGKNWEVDNGGVVRKWIDLTVDMLKNEPVSVPEGTSEDDKKKFIEAKEKFVRRTRNNAGKEAMMREVKHNIAVLPEEFDQDDMLFNTQNGFIDLSNGVIHEHAIDKMFTRISNVEYTDKTDCPRWELFLEQVFDNDHELINYVKKAVGYSLSASTREQVMFFLYGNGRNGKSVFLEIINEVMGTYGMSMQADSLMVKRGGSNGHNEDIARLNGARLVTSSEPNEGVRLDEGLIKQLTGGDVVSASFKGGHVFDYKPQYKIWVATNHKPIIRGNDDGIWRRLPLIPFTVQIPMKKVDKNLVSKLRLELPGILNWAVEGCLMWQREGLTPPETIQKATMDYQKEMDVIGSFIEECCEVSSGLKIGATEVYKVYDKWAKEMNEHNFSQTQFGKKMADRFEKKHTKNGRIYVGVTLKKKYKEFNMKIPGL